MLVSAGLYAQGARRAWRHPAGRHAVSSGRAAAFAGGWLALALALASPLHPPGDVPFSAHVTQHGLLMLVAAPLFALARPGIPLLWALPWHRRERLAIRLRRPRVRSAWRTLTHPVIAFALHAAALWVWHVPALFEDALRHDAIHAVQHFSFFWTAVLFWWALVHGRYGRLGYGVAVLFLFTTALHGGALGALLTWAPAVWYGTDHGRTAEWGLSALENEQLAGPILWVPAALVFLVVGLALLAAWLGESDRRAELGRAREAAQGVPRSRDAR
jgi:putative membrane protein